MFEQGSSSGPGTLSSDSTGMVQRAQYASASSARGGPVYASRPSEQGRPYPHDFLGPEAWMNQEWKNSSAQ